MKKVLVIGSGGVGTVTALALSSTGEAEITMIVRTDYDTVSEEGYHFDSIDYGTVKNWKPARIVKSTEDAVAGGPYDYIVVCTKYIPEVQKTEDVLRPYMHKGITVVLVQNGLGNEEPVMEAFPDSYVLGGVSMIGSINYNGKVKHTGADEIVIGTYDERPEAIASAKEYVRLYNGSKSKAEFTDNLGARRWAKLSYNATYNTVAALTGVDTGRMVFAGITESIIIPAMAEVRQIAEAELNAPLPKDLEKIMLNCDASNYYNPSMLVDVIKGRPMELEAILGNPLRIAHKNGTPAPILQTLYNLLRGKQLELLEKRGQITLPERGFDPNTAKSVFEPTPW